MKSAVVDILPPKLIVLVPLFTPVPPNVPAIGSVKSAVPLNERPYILLAVCNCVVVLELPAKLAVIIPALKLPLPSLLTIVLGVLSEVAEAILLAIVVIVEELTPPTVFTLGKSAVPPKSPANRIIPLSVAVAPVAELVIWARTKAVVATCVLLASEAGVGAVGVPVNDGDEIVGVRIVGDSIVLLVKVSVPANVAIVPVVGKVILVTPVLVRVVL